MTSCTYRIEVSASEFGNGNMRVVARRAGHIAFLKTGAFFEAEGMARNTETFRIVDLSSRNEYAAIGFEGDTRSVGGRRFPGFEHGGARKMALATHGQLITAR